MITPKKLEQDVVNALIPQLTSELDASYFYRSASNWCKNAGYNNASKYFDSESKDELVHAQGLQDYLTDWNVIPNLPNVDKPVLKFDGLVDIIEQAYQMELDLYESYESLAKKMMSSDLCTFAVAQKYLAIQVKSVAEYSDFINSLNLIDSKDKFQLYYWENETFE